MRRVAALASLFVCFTALVHCADVSSEADSDIKKRTKPKAGMGAVLVQKPNWYDPVLFDGDVKIFNSARIDDSMTSLALDAQRDFSPAVYNVFFRPKRGLRALASTDVLGFQWRTPATRTNGSELAVGVVWEVVPAGLRIEVDRALVWTGDVEAASLMAPSPAAVLCRDRNYGGMSRHTDLGMADAAMASLTFYADHIAQGRRSTNLLLPAETYKIALGPGGSKTVALEPGKLTTVPLKALSMSVALDEIDPAFPDAAGSCTKMSFGGVVEPVRALSKFRTAILPESADVRVESFGLVVPSVVTGNARTFNLNRLELDDVEVNAAGGGTQRVRGTATIEAKVAGAWKSISCAGTVSTKTGLDLPDGTYRITTTATGPSGVVKHVEEISFP
ncbi:MAG: hypothetical protein U0174_16525 [Polyangiaceae bacterium]